MKKAYSLFAAVMLLMTTLSFRANAQEESPLSIGADLVSRYVWRGLNLGGPAAHIQPYMEYSFGNSGLAVGAWGSYGLGATTGASAEADIYLSYTPIDAITFIVTDYFLPSEDPEVSNKYFNYSDTTGHVLEAMVVFNGTESLPLSATFAMNVWGADKSGNAEGKNDYSTYLEVAYNPTIGDVDFSVFAGATLTSPEDGYTGFYGQENAGLINLGISASKAIPVTESYSLPISGSLVVNPSSEQIFMTFGISF